MSQKTKKQILHPDFCIIGAGAGGRALALKAAQRGAQVVLIERNKMKVQAHGNDACIASQALLKAAKLNFSLKNSGFLGNSDSDSKLDFKKILAYISGVFEAQQKDSKSDTEFQSQAKEQGIQLILDEARFLNDITVSTQTYLIRAEHFVVATGSKAFIPPIVGLETVQYYTAETIWNLPSIPEHLVVMGGTSIGIEMAQAFHRFGTKVTVLEVGDILAKNDCSMVLRLKNILTSQGVRFNEQVHIVRVYQTTHGISIAYKNHQGLEHTIIASHLLVTAGRIANVAQLNLEAAKVHKEAHGIRVDSKLCTSNPRVYAIGDCITGHSSLTPSVHLAHYHADLVIQHSMQGMQNRFSGFSSQAQYIPTVTYTDPELAQIGLSEAMLQAENKNYIILEVPFEQNDRAKIEKQTQGWIKVLVDPQATILGVSILAPGASELIYPWIIMMQNRLKITALSNIVIPYPSLHEINKNILECYFAQQKQSDWMGRFMQVAYQKFQKTACFFKRI